MRSTDVAAPLQRNANGEANTLPTPTPTKETNGFLKEGSKQEKIWGILLDREKQTGQWGSKQVHKRDIPLAFIEQWQSHHSKEAPE